MLKVTHQIYISAKLEIWNAHNGFSVIYIINYIKYFHLQTHYIGNDNSNNFIINKIELLVKNYVSS